MTIHSFYEVLGVSRNATPAEIKSAFRKHAKEWHPDRNKRPDAAERFRAYCEAYECLSCPTTRAGYDELLRRAESDDEAFRTDYSTETQQRKAEPMRPSPLEILLNEWNAKLTLEPAHLVALFVRIDAWLARVMASRARRHS